MPSLRSKFETIDEYIQTFPPDVQGILEHVRRTIREVAPSAVEAISYQMPTFKLDGSYLIYFAAWKKHIGLYPIPSGNEDFEREISLYRGAKGTARFPLAKPIPYDLVKEMVASRIKEIQE
jgi:uncharacterized protein YdhG (YjbR/CyaY superfamily)